jgi:hypothetical protein
VTGGTLTRGGRPTITLPRRLAEPGIQRTDIARRGLQLRVVARSVEKLAERAAQVPQRRGGGRHRYRPPACAGRSAAYGTTTTSCVSSRNLTRAVSGYPVSGSRDAGSRYTP